MGKKNLFIAKVSKHIRDHTLCGEGDRILVGISGGPDSVCLAWVMHEMGYEVGLAHVNYQMRGEDSEYEQKLVESYGQKWGLPVFIKGVEGKKLTEGKSASFQLLAREVRYSFFEEVRLREKYDWLATAHHKDDQVENLLMSLIKGSSQYVFKGIPLKTGTTIRPLLEVSKIEILEVLEEEKLSYGLDISNQTNVYLRNQIRNQLLPQIKDINPSFSDRLLHSFHHYQEQQVFIKEKLSEWVKEWESQSLMDWRKFVEENSEAFLPLFVSKVLEGWGVHGHELEVALKLIDSQVGKWVQTSKGRLFRTQHGLEWEAREAVKMQKIILQAEEVEGTYTIGSSKVSLQLIEAVGIIPKEVGIQYADWDRLEFPINIRRWEAGDKMKPIGMFGKKKVSDILTERKVSPAKKSGILLLEDQQEIFSLQGFRISERVKLKKGSSLVLKIVFGEA